MNFSSYVNYGCRRHTSSNSITLCFQDCVFTKLAYDTALKVEYNGDFRIAYCLDYCKRWYFTFDGAECKGPLAIDGLVHIYRNQSKTDSNIHKTTYIGGYCQGISAGTVRVGINVGDCVGKKSGSDAYTGWNSVTRIMLHPRNSFKEPQKASNSLFADHKQQVHL